MGVVEVAGVVAAVAAVLTLGDSAVKALWSIGNHLGKSQGRIDALLAHHHEKINDHEDRIRVVEAHTK